MAHLQFDGANLKLLDTSGNELLRFVVTSSAVNDLSVTNAATGNPPKLSATGDDTNIAIAIQPKGTGGIQLLDGDGNEILLGARTASAVNEVTLTNAATNGNPLLAATGGDTNIHLELRGKGTGTVIAQANVAAANVIGGLDFLHIFSISDAASGDSDITLTHKTRVVDAWFVKTAGAGAASNTYTVKNGATAITNAMDGNVADQAIGRATTIDDAQHEVAASGTLRVSWNKAGGNSAALVYVRGVRVA